MAEKSSPPPTQPSPTQEEPSPTQEMESSQYLFTPSPPTPPLPPTPPAATTTTTVIDISSPPSFARAASMVGKTFYPPIGRKRISLSDDDGAQPPSKKKKNPAPPKLPKPAASRRKFATAALPPPFVPTNGENYHQRSMAVLQLSARLGNAWAHYMMPRLQTGELSGSETSLMFDLCHCVEAVFNTFNN